MGKEMGGGGPGRRRACRKADLGQDESGGEVVSLQEKDRGK